MNLMSSTLKDDESGEPLHIQQAKQIRRFREEWRNHDHGFEPRVSVSRSIIRSSRTRTGPTSWGSATPRTSSA